MFGLPNQYLIGGAALAFVLATGAAGIYGHARGYDAAEKVYQLRIDKMVIEAKDAAQKSRQAMLDQADAALTTLETQNVKARVVYKTLTQTVDRLVDRPIYRNACLDDTGLRLANAALGGVAVAPPNPGEPNSGMPAVIIPQ